MEYVTSDNMRGIARSAIEEFFKHSGDPAFIPMAMGNPDPEALPEALLSELMGKVAREDMGKALSYSVGPGYTPLRDALKDRLAVQNCFEHERDELMIFSGSLQVADIACRVLCNRGDTVICEEPSFVGCVNSFRSNGAKIVGVPIEEDGVIIDRLEQALKENPNARLIYLIPNFQNPTGYTMSEEKRKAAYALAKKYGVPIFEDDPYGDLRFSGNPVPAIKTMDSDGLVIYARSFSKILAAGIRAAYASFPKELFEAMYLAKQCADIHASMLAQLLCYRFVTERDMTQHLAGMKDVYRRKAARALAELDKLPKDKISYSKPEGGLFIWLTLRENQDGGDFALRLVREKKAAVVPGSAFTANYQPSPSFRITFSALSEEQITRGIEAIGQLL
ncbi:MAG: PLP-dependent aminotransferase family protein [Oscillospiraceae bacterium]|nr:PLP-dependent aminotransferase family protein [Oscillospiraceae bacterium]